MKAFTYNNSRMPRLRCTFAILIAAEIRTRFWCLISKHLLNNHAIAPRQNLEDFSELHFQYYRLNCLNGLRFVI